jgi:hypothetical protein
MVKPTWRACLEAHRADGGGATELPRRWPPRPAGGRSGAGAHRAGDGCGATQVSSSCGDLRVAAGGAPLKAEYDRAMLAPAGPPGGQETSATPQAA